MVGAAYGDSLGASVEFKKLHEIKKEYGENGIEVCAPAFGHEAGVITDDTQMAIATAYGILYARDINNDESILNSIWNEYLGWYKSQSIIENRRGPGNICLSALASGIMGTLNRPLNSSPACGGIMRVHPIGIAFSTNPARAFDLGVKSAVITHGDSRGYLPAGFLAVLIAKIVEKYSFNDSLNFAIDSLEENYYEVRKVIKIAMNAPLSGDAGEIIDKEIGKSDPRGAGWLGHDALAVALYAVRRSPNDSIKAVRIAVNHSGDSDSTGSIAGAIVGAIFGYKPFIEKLKKDGIKLEKLDELIEIAKRLAQIDA